MKIQLTEKPEGVTIIEGFPGYGLVGTIVTEYLIDHLKPKMIGQFVYDELPATIAIHDGQLVNPMAIYYSKEFDLVILHTILNTAGHEWRIADLIVEMANDLKAKQIVSIEGVASQVPEDKTKLFYFGSEQLAKCGAEPIRESIIVGVTASVLLRYSNTSCIFAETNSQLPDSKASAKVIELLDCYLKLNVDPKPLLKQAETFEKKLKTMMRESKKIEKESEEKKMSYVG